MWNLIGSNKLCKDRDIAREHYLHLNKLKNIKSALNTQKPRSQSHLKTNLKQEQLKREREDQIEFQNQLLLKKMLEIDVKSSSITPRSVKTAHNRSLNRFTRINEITRISKDNHKILSMITGAKSTYSRHKQREDYDFKQYLVYKLSENAGRVPRSISFTNESFVIGSLSAEASRPSSAANIQKSESHRSRPMTADGRSRNSKGIL